MRRLAATVALLMCCAGLASAEPHPHALVGLPLDEALRILQRTGLRLVFTSEIVTPTMRVLSEPRAGIPAQQLEEILQPHGLRAQPGPGGILQIVRSRSARESAPMQRSGALIPSEAPTSAGDPATDSTRFNDEVTVIGSDGPPAELHASAFERNDLEMGSSVLQGDVMGAVHAMPHVSAVDDFRNEFSVRGSPYQQIGVVIDGVSTPWLQHSVYGRADAGSQSMIASAIVDQAVLEVGAYPRRYDDTLGAQLQLTLRDGSRETTHFSGTLGGTSAAFLAEGPLGADARGSWIASVRDSYRMWPTKRLTPTGAGAGFEFADGHAKLVYDVTSKQHVDLTVLAGRSTPDTFAVPGRGLVEQETDGAGLFALGWRTTLGPRTVIQQQLSWTGQALHGISPAGQPTGQRTDASAGYRVEALQKILGGVLEAGTESHRISGTRNVPFDGLPALGEQAGAAWWNRSAYANFARTAEHGMSFAGGLRASVSTLVHDGAVSPWLLGAWRFTPQWAVHASVGGSQQFPDLDAVLSQPAGSGLAPERAELMDVGIEQRLSKGIRWQVTVYERKERDVLDAPDPYPTLVQGVSLEEPGPNEYRNSLRGSSRGADLLVARDTAARVSGWFAYTYATTRQTDAITGETFAGDFDQRHAVNAEGIFRLAPETRLGIVFRGASGVPLPGYFQLQDGALFLGDRRNGTRLPAYMRLDARMQRTWLSAPHRMTLFGEVLNVLNRTHRGPAAGVVQPLTGEATGFSQTLLTRRMSGGITIDLSR